METHCLNSVVGYVELLRKLNADNSIFLPSNNLTPERGVLSLLRGNGDSLGIFLKICQAFTASFRLSTGTSTINKHQFSKVHFCINQMATRLR